MSSFNIITIPLIIPIPIHLQLCDHAASMYAMGDLEARRGGHLRPGSKYYKMAAHPNLKAWVDRVDSLQQDRTAQVLFSGLWAMKRFRPQR